MSERRSAVFVNKSKVVPKALSTECQVCKVYDALFQCNMCKRNVCMHDKIMTKNNDSYCKICINDRETSPYIVAVVYNDKRKTCYSETKGVLLYIMSGNWIRRKKDEWARTP